MLSKVDIIEVTIGTPRDRPADVLTNLQGVPRITGLAVYRDGEFRLNDPEGITYIIASPVKNDLEGVYVHFAIGDLKSRLVHNISIEGLTLIRDNLSTIIELATLEQGDRKP